MKPPLHVLTACLFIVVGCKNPSPTPQASGACLQTTIVARQHDATTDRLIGTVDASFIVFNSGSADAANVMLSVSFLPTQITMTPIPASLQPAGVWGSPTAVPLQAILGTIPAHKAAVATLTAKSDAQSTFNLVLNANVTSATSLPPGCSGDSRTNLEIVVIF